MKPLKIPTLTCKRCGHTWVPKKPVVKVCPNPRCHSPAWDRKHNKPVGRPRKED